MLARELSGDVDVLIVANPCFGLDFASVAEIRAQIMEQRNRGAAVLLVSEDLDEILELADRIAVMSGGKIDYVSPGAKADRPSIGRAWRGTDGGFSPSLRLHVHAEHGFAMTRGSGPALGEGRR